MEAKLELVSYPEDLMKITIRRVGRIQKFTRIIRRIKNLILEILK